MEVHVYSIGEAWEERGRKKVDIASSLQHVRGVNRMDIVGLKRSKAFHRYRLDGSS
jgi:hypothetical protein